MQIMEAQKEKKKSWKKSYVYLDKYESKMKDIDDKFFQLEEGVKKLNNVLRIIGITVGIVTLLTVLTIML